jgi:hypothetical protein
MTMTMGDPMTGRPQPPPPPEGGLPEYRPSLLAMPTHEIELSPAFLEALKRVAPKTRRRKLPYVLALAFVAAATTVGGVPWLRHRAGAIAIHLLHRDAPTVSVSPPPPALDTASAAATSTATPALVTSTVTADSVPSIPRSATSAPTSPKNPKKLQRRLGR